MPVKRKVRAVRKRRGVRRARRTGVPRSMNPRYQVATVVETLDPGVSFLENVPAFQNISLQSFKRCLGMSNLYEQFRIEEVKYTYTPLYNTFQEQAGTGGPSVPAFYYTMDRLQSLNPSTTTLTDLVQKGAQRRLFSKPISIKYRPNTMVTTGIASNQVSIVSGAIETLQINGADYGRWFPCTTQNIGGASLNTPNTLSAHTQLYNGHWTYFEQASASAGSVCATIAITIRCSFMNPLVNETPVSPIPVAWSPTVGYAENRTRRVFEGLQPPITT